MTQATQHDPIRGILAVPSDRLATATSSREAALDVLEEVRWRDGCDCPHCGSDRTREVGSRNDRRLRQCRDCRGQFSWRHGTFLFGDRNDPRSVVMAFLAAADGETVEAAAAAVRSLGVGHDRALKLAVRVFDIAERVADVEPGRDTDAPPVQLQPESPVRSRARLWSLAAALIFLLVPSPPEEQVENWSSNGAKMTWVTPRHRGEPYAEWVRRHADEVRELMAIYPPDPQR